MQFGVHSEADARRTTSPQLRRWPMAIVTACVAACAGHGTPVTVTSPHQLEPRTTVEFQVRDSVVRLHGVRVTDNAMTGIPWLAALDCDSCVVSYPLALVHQPHTVNPGEGTARTGVAILAVFVGVGFFLRLGGLGAD